MNWNRLVRDMVTRVGAPVRNTGVLWASVCNWMDETASHQLQRLCGGGTSCEDTAMEQKENGSEELSGGTVP
jgi:hypothetical protein